MRKSARFRQAVERLQAECERRGLDLPSATAENVLAGLVHDMADRLRVKEATVVRTYLDGIDTGSLAADLVRADTKQKQEIADASPAVMDIESTGRQVASLAQAVRCVSLNHDQLAGDSDNKWRAVGVLDDASNALTLIGAALERHHRASQDVAIFWSDEGVIYARRALAQTVANLRAGTWSFGHGPEVDAGVVERMQKDLDLLPEQQTDPSDSCCPTAAHRRRSAWSTGRAIPVRRQTRSRWWSSIPPAERRHAARQAALAAVTHAGGLGRVGAHTTGLGGTLL